MKNNNDINFVISAPTHKACNILRKQGLKAFTIHRLLKAERDYTDEGDLYYDFFPNEYKDVLIIVDECSMINNEMFAEFKKISKNNYVVFVGDILQLIQVNQNGISKTFKETDQVFKFTKNMRCLDKTSSVYLNNARLSWKKKQLPPSLNKKEINEVVKFFENNEIMKMLFWHIVINKSITLTITI